MSKDLKWHNKKININEKYLFVLSKYLGELKFLKKITNCRTKRRIRSAQAEYEKLPKIFTKPTVVNILKEREIINKRYLFRSTPA